jgi:fructokinase
MPPDARLRALAERIAQTSFSHKRRLIALAGAPASGKSTLAHALCALVPGACVVPMDGFHLDNALLEARGLLARKGAPETFDARGFLHLMTRLRDEDEVFYPVFDRTTEQAIAAAGVVGPETETIIVEGNYLLLDRPIWRDLAPLWDLSIYFNVAEDSLRKRLMDRWLGHGYSTEQAHQKSEANDLPNARTIAAHLLPADITFENSEDVFSGT